MFHKGLNKELLIETAKDLIDEYGYSNFSMRLLADKLGVKTASLYTHIDSMNSLITEVGLLVLKEQKEYLMSYISGKHRGQAVMALALAYRNFAKEHKELYRFIMQIPISSNDELKRAATMVTEPFMHVLIEYKFSNKQKMHWQRILRGTMHGFISQEEYGYFSHYPIDVEESYKLAIQCLIEGLNHEEAIYNEQ